MSLTRHLAAIFATCSAVALATATPVEAAGARFSAQHAIAHALYRTQRFHSQPGLRPPVVFKTGRDPDPLASGDIFVDVHNAFVAGPMILSPSGQLIWWDPLPSRGYAYNVRVQQYQGQPVLTFFQGGGRVLGIGYDVILNNQYRQIATVGAGDGWLTEEHDFQITPAGTALITAQKDVPHDLSSVGGPRHGVVHDAEIQEIQIATGQVLWQWDALKHIRLTASYAGKPASHPYDFCHMNSVQALPNGDLLASCRHTWAVYEISKSTGRIIWQLGGKNSSFRIGRGANFEWQHDAQMHGAKTITLFDNAAGLSDNEPQSRALVIHLNFKQRRATLVRAYTNNRPLLATSQGSVEPLADGNTFVDWGVKPYFSEFSRRGRELFSFHFPYPIQTYRGYRSSWSGQPVTPPSLALARTSTGTRVYASWNGATGVASWVVLAGASPGALTQLAQFRKTSFETAMWVETTQPFVQVQALDQNGNVLGASVTVQR